MSNRLLERRAETSLTVLDPCVGPFTFPRAMLSAGLLRPTDRLVLVDVDAAMVSISEANARRHGLKFLARTGDYLTAENLPPADYAILNPPYLRQEWIDPKNLYRRRFSDLYGVEVPGTSNLYVYFLVKVLNDLKNGGRFACIVYDSWLYTRFGRWLAELLSNACDEIETEQLRGQPFDGRLIDATIIYGRKGNSRGRSSPLPAATGGLVAGIDGFEPVDQLFEARRGLRLKQADFFRCHLSECEELGGTPFLKKVGGIRGYRVPDDHPDAALLVQGAHCDPRVIRELERRAERAQHDPESNVSILTWISERPHKWFTHRSAPFAPIVFNYYLRNRPRHILNPIRPYADNFYGLTPRGQAPVEAWLAALNSTAVSAEILSRSRNQGNGLAKIQLFEYRKVCVPNVEALPSSSVDALASLGRALSATPCQAPSLIRRIDRALVEVYGCPELEPSAIEDLYAQADSEARRSGGAGGGR
jgi:adenine-specific DNA-methyltransferase